MIIHILYLLLFSCMQGELCESLPYLYVRYLYLYLLGGLQNNKVWESLIYMIKSHFSFETIDTQYIFQNIFSHYCFHNVIFINWNSAVKIGKDFFLKTGNSAANRPLSETANVQISNMQISKAANMWTWLKWSILVRLLKKYILHNQRKRQKNLQILSNKKGLEMHLLLDRVSTKTPVKCLNCSTVVK